MPSRSAISGAWSAQDREAARSEMAGHADALRQCVKVSADGVSYSKSCMEKAVPKGTGKGLWTA